MQKYVCHRFSLVLLAVAGEKTRRIVGRRRPEAESVGSLGRVCADVCLTSSCTGEQDRIYKFDLYFTPDGEVFTRTNICDDG